MARNPALNAHIQTLAFSIARHLRHRYGAGRAILGIVGRAAAFITFVGCERGRSHHHSPVRRPSAVEKVTYSWWRVVKRSFSLAVGGYRGVLSRFESPEGNQDVGTRIRKWALDLAKAVDAN